MVTKVVDGVKEEEHTVLKILLLKAQWAIAIIQVLWVSSKCFLAVQDSSISDIIGLSVGLSEPTNNQSLEIRIAMETNTTVGSDC